MVLGYHAIFSTYGFWLPNDPRGSWSDWIRKWELLAYGPATKVDTRRSVAGVPHDRDLRMRAKEALSFPEVKFTGLQAKLVGDGFGTAIHESGYRVFACSILPQHVHMVIGRHDRTVERIVGHLKSRATQQLKAAAQHPLASFELDNGLNPSPWAAKCWKVFQSTIRDIRRAIRYVEENPLRERKPRQNWPFVLPLPDERPLIENARSKLRR